MKLLITPCLLGLGLSLLLTSCTMDHGSASLPPPPPPGLAGQYSIQEGDLLSIMFAGEPDLSQQVRVDWNGTINMPSLSPSGGAEIRAAGISPAVLAEKLSSYAVQNHILVNARAQVLVMEYASQAYSILGQVTQPGRYNFPRGVQPRLTIEEAVALAGGYTRLARQSKVLLKRGSQVYAVDLKKLASQPGHPPVIIIPGDVITVTERMF